MNVTAPLSIAKTQNILDPLDLANSRLVIALSKDRAAMAEDIASMLMEIAHSIPDQQHGQTVHTLGSALYDVLQGYAMTDLRCRLQGVGLSVPQVDWLTGPL